MASVETTQGNFEVCTCGNAEGHSGAVWHPGVEHPSGAKLKKGQEKVLEPLLEGYKRAERAQAAFAKAMELPPQGEK